MEQYKKFISNIKKIRLANDFISVVFLIGGIMFAIICNIPLIIKLAIVIFVFLIFCKILYNYYKLNHFWGKLDGKDQQLILKELSTLFFEGIDYALTENCIIDLKKRKIIPFNLIVKMEKIDKIISNHVNSEIQTYIKIFTDESVYKYRTSSKMIGISIGKPLHYKNLYSYIKFKNPNVKE